VQRKRAGLDQRGYPTSGPVSIWDWLTFASSNRVRTLSVFNQPPRPTQPGHPSGVGKTNTGVKTWKVTAGYGKSVV